jgi:hypothetical protein
LKETDVKKIALALVAVPALVLAACGDRDADTNTAADINTEATANEADADVNAAEAANDALNTAGNLAEETGEAVENAAEAVENAVD